MGQPTIHHLPGWAVFVTVSALAVVLAELLGLLQYWLGETTTRSVRGVLYMISVLSLTGSMVGWYLMSLSYFAPLETTSLPQSFLTFRFWFAALELMVPVLGFFFGLYALTRMVMLDVFDSDDGRMRVK